MAANDKKLASICLVNARSATSSLCPLSYMVSNVPAFQRTLGIPLSFRAGKGLLLLQRAKQRQYGLKRASVMRISNENLVESVIWRPYRACIIGLGDSSRFAGRPERIDLFAAVIGCPASSRDRDSRRALPAKAPPAPGAYMGSPADAKSWVSYVSRVRPRQKAPSLQRAMAMQMLEVVIHMPQHKVAGDGGLRNH